MAPRNPFTSLPYALLTVGLFCFAVGLVVGLLLGLAL